MGFTDTLRAALEKKRAGQHPDAKASDDNDKKKPAGSAPVVQKPQKKITGRGR